MRLFLWIMMRCLPSERPSLHVKWLKRALLDLDEVDAYIAQDNPSAADDVVLKILKAVSRTTRARSSGPCSRNQRACYS